MLRNTKLRTLALASPELLDTLGTYYQTAPLELAEPLPKFHQYRVRLGNGKFLRIKDRIRSVEHLRKWLIRLVPLDCYAMANPFLDCPSVSHAEFNGKRAGYNHAENFLIGDGIIAFDTDFHDRSFERAKQDALTIIDYLHERGYEVSEVVYTGNGFHVKSFNHDLHLPRSYSSRNNQAVFNMYRELREPLVKDLEDHGVQLDREITLDSKRILRVVGSVNSKVPSICTRIHDLERFGEFEAEQLRLEGVSPVTRKIGSDGRFFLKQMQLATHSGDRVAAPCKNTKPDESNSETSTLKPSIYLGSFVIGTLDRQIILLRFPQPIDVSMLKERLSRFAMRERLAPFLIFRARKDSEAIYALSPSAIQFDGMKRLLRKFPTQNACYQKFRKRIVPLPVEYVGQTSGIIDTEKPVSRAHFMWMKHYGIASYQPKVLAGSTILSTPIGEMKI